MPAIAARSWSLMTNLGDAPVELEGRRKDRADGSGSRPHGPVQEVEILEVSARAEKGFGSSG